MNTREKIERIKREKEKFKSWAKVGKEAKVENKDSPLKRKKGLGGNFRDTIKGNWHHIKKTVEEAASKGKHFALGGLLIVAGTVLEPEKTAATTQNDSPVKNIELHYGGQGNDSLEIERISNSTDTLQEASKDTVIFNVVRNSTMVNGSERYSFQICPINGYGNEIVEEDDLANSLYDGAYARETANESNPVGAVSRNKLYYGPYQASLAAAKGMLCWALAHPEYDEITNRFFNKRAGFEQKKSAFLKEANNPNAYYQSWKSLRDMQYYLKPNFMKLFESEGKNNPEHFMALNMQFFREIQTHFDTPSLNKIKESLKKFEIEARDVCPGVYMVLKAGHIAKGNYRWAATLFAETANNCQNKEQMLEKINSKEFMKRLGNYSHSTPVLNVAYQYTSPNQHSLQTLCELDAMFNTKYLAQYIENNKTNRMFAVNSPVTNNKKKDNKLSPENIIAMNMKNGRVNG